MKKVFSLTFFLFLVSASVMASGYKLDDNSMDAMFASADDITMQAANGISGNMLDYAAPTPPDQTVGGFLVRSFFCGAIALHGSYMGTGGKKMWYLYLCVPVAGQVASLGDFCFVLFKGEDALNKYKDNSSWFVWTGN